MTKKRLLIHLVVFLSALLIVLFDNPQTIATPRSSNPLTIAALLHLTGEYAQAGQAFYEGALLAQQEINAARTNGEPELKIIFEDTQYNMKTVNTLSQKALHIDNVPLALVSNYTEVMVAGPVFERSKTPLITLWDSSPEIEKL
ncbi:MAG: ABC transporter substrate-binding protein, partial [Bdellovibrionales bacterium]|nr:ABC transporter substrate-binding protein [Bdellovibrionales bacterium]